MQNLINVIFDGLAKAFDSIPMLAKLKGYRSTIGLIVLALTYVPQISSHFDPTISNQIRAGLAVFTGLALNASGRPTV